MSDPDNAFLAGLLEFASLPDSNGNSSSTPPAQTDTALHCGFCLKAKYKHQSSLDSHIQTCSRDQNFAARFWREAGWTRAGLEAGFTFQDGHPVVNPNRICQHCSKIFANPLEARKHLSAARCLSVRSRPDVPPTVLSGLWKCGFCERQPHYKNQSTLDDHVKLCAPRHGYKAKFWKEAGWGPDSRLGRGLDFKDGVATAKAERICQTCYSCCKSLVGLTRHLRSGQCPGEPDEKGQEPPPPPPSETIAHLARNGIVMKKYRPASPVPLVRTKELARPETNSSAPLRTTEKVKSSTMIPHSTDGVPPQSARKPLPASEGRFAESRRQKAASVSRHVETEETSSDFEFLSKLVNTEPSPAITELLIKIARAEPEARAIPKAPVRPRQKRIRESESAVASLSRKKAARDDG
ncbi:uncharacterized protein RCC_04051 [Ramularia collo-cygni]|uniref:Uncharacterized protein n=1 Tax=Ramularia collo-cygni TaxID=112498 RepID=A0A2D3UTC4_9PEZI|nr:uncharacterized protein RCC_04051 [Ramularia collo-cygni]CZT18208.1 uncharacterized protein RCC_04051 [Ramularia collo-cygni]